MIPVMVIPTLMHYDLLQAMLDTVDYPIGHLVIIDNGGNLKHVDCPQASQISIVSLPTNIGVAPAWNLGIKLTPFAEWWLIGSDDILWVPDHLRLYEEFMDTNTLIIESPSAHGMFSGFAVHESVIDRVGLFDEYYYPGVGEELNYINRVNAEGVTIRAVPGAYTTESGRTRLTLQQQYPRTESIIFDNLVTAGTGGTTVRGWDLRNRRRSDPTRR